MRQQNGMVARSIRRAAAELANLIPDEQARELVTLEHEIEELHGSLQMKRRQSTELALSHVAKLMKLRG